MENNLGQVQNALLEAKIELAAWLEEKLQKLDKNFWKDMVLPKLSYQQNAMIEQNNKTQLQELDLTCILRIFDKNWYDLSFRYNLKPEIRSYIKSLQIIRNKYAHPDSHISIRAKNNDISTLYSLLKTLNVAEKLQRELTNLIEPTDEKEIEQKATSVIIPYANDPGEIHIKDIVSVNALQDQRGVVLGINGNEYSVFINGEIKSFYREQITKQTKEETPFIPLSYVRNYLSSYVIRHPTTSSLYSLNAARINLIPYQFKPVMKIIKSDQPRLLIADSVGIGKTIEAGLILRELQIRNDVKSVLIICPKPLVTEKKWEQEMKRFDEDFEAIDANTLRHCINECDLEGEWPDKHQKIIMPYSVCDDKCLKQLEKLNPFPKFDLVIVDEAHHIRNQSAIRHQVVKKFCDAAEAVVFLTATPIQLGNRDLYSLLNLLRPDLIVDEDTFDVMHTPNRYITEAIQCVHRKEYGKAIENLEFAANNTEGGRFIVNRPDFKEILDDLRKNDTSKEKIVELSDAISKLHTFDSLINRTLRKQISSDFCIRKPETVRSEFTAEERNIFNELRSLKADILQTFAGIDNVNFVMTTLERQAASCIHGLVPSMKDILSKTITLWDYEDDEDIDIDGVSISFDDKVLQKYQAKIDRLVEKAQDLSDVDPKFEAFFGVINEKQTMENKKVIVFSTFRHTLEYLYRRLQERNIRVGLIHGGIDDEERLAIRKRFEKDSNEEDAFDVLLFSEVGCEGLDYQFCDTMINYDLPWNPMKIEQRIGRIDRFGQKSEAVAIYNMIVNNTIDAHIYDRCLSRIKIFEQSIGDCDEILGDIHTEIRKVYANTTLTDEQKQLKLEKISENNYRNIMQQRELEEQQVALFSVPSRLSAMEEFESFENYWVSPLALEHLVSSYLKDKVCATFMGIGDKRTLRLSEDARKTLFEDYLQLPMKKGRIYKDWEKYLKGAEQFCGVTFDIEQASRDSKMQFIMPLHPLVTAAARHFHAQMPIKTALQVIDNDVPAGEYPFMIYSWEYAGNSPTIKLKPICDNEVIEQNLLTYLETGAELEQYNEQQSDYERLKSTLHQLWNSEVETYKQKVHQQVDYQINSLTISADARKNVAARNNLPDIRPIMIAKIEKEKQEKIAKLKQQSEKADILYKPILSGVIKIIHEQ